MYDYISCNFYGEEEFICRGSDACNDAKILASRESKKRQNDYTVTVVKIEKTRWDKEGGYKVVCTPTPHGIAKLEAERVLNREKYPNVYRDYEDPPRRQNPRRTKKPRKTDLPHLIDDRIDVEVLEDTLSVERVPHRGGWKDIYLPTHRRRDARTDKRTWKRKRRTQYNPAAV